MKNKYVQKKILQNATRTVDDQIGDFMNRKLFIPILQQSQDRSQFDFTVADIVLVGIIRVLEPGASNDGRFEEFCAQMRTMVLSYKDKLQKLDWLIVDCSDYKWHLSDGNINCNEIECPSFRIIQCINLSDFVKRYKRFNKVRM